MRGNERQNIAAFDRRAGGHGGGQTNVIGSTSAHERRGTQSHAQARGISDALACRARPALGGGAQGDGRARARWPDPVRLAGDVGLQHRQRALPLPHRRQCRVQRVGLSARGRAHVVHLFAGVHRLLARRAELGVRRAPQARHVRRQRRRPAHGTGLSGAAVGIDGLAGPLEPDGWVPHSMYTRLRERLPKMSLVNLDDMMEKLRTVKSAEEIAILEKAAALGDLMLQACRDTARPGVKECEVYARMMEVMLANGGEEPTLFLWAADAHPYPHPFRVPTTRPLAKNDMIICEMHPKFGGYFTHVERTFCLGEPEPRYLDIYG